MTNVIESIDEPDTLRNEVVDNNLLVSDNWTTEQTAMERLRKLLYERGIEYETDERNAIIKWSTHYGAFVYFARQRGSKLLVETTVATEHSVILTPEQAIAATLGNDPYETVSCEHVISPDILHLILDEWDTHPGWTATNENMAQLLNHTATSEVDTREKLENEIRSMRKRSNADFFHSNIWVEVPIGVVFKWLDRQAAITANEKSHDNSYVGLIRGKQWERTEISDYYCGRCRWKVTDHDSYCPECGGALHKASNKPDSKFDARKTAEMPETDAVKGDMHNFDDSREKLEEDVIGRATLSYYGDGTIRLDSSYMDCASLADVFDWLDRQAAITSAEWERATDMVKAKRDELERELEGGAYEPKWTLQGKTQTQEFWRCECGNCGECFGIETRESFPFRVTIDKVNIPNYCPKCGKKVKESNND